MHRTPEVTAAIEAVRRGCAQIEDKLASIPEDRYVVLWGGHPLHEVGTRIQLHGGPNHKVYSTDFWPLAKKIAGYFRTSPSVCAAGVAEVHSVPAALRLVRQKNAELLRSLDCEGFAQHT